MDTGDTASDPFSRSAENEARRDPSRSRGDASILTPPGAAGQQTSPKSTAEHPAEILRKSGR
jgi:hypothetical protein